MAEKLYPGASSVAIALTKQAEFHELQDQRDRTIAQCICRRKIAAFDLLSPYQCWLCGQTTFHCNSDVPAMCPECAKDRGVCAWCGREIK